MPVPERPSIHHLLPIDRLCSVNEDRLLCDGASSSERMALETAVPQMTTGCAVLIELMQRYLNGLLDPFISQFELHKLMYFMQETGEPLHLKYQRAYSGPYAENLRHVLNAIEGYMISGYSDGGDLPDKQLTLVPGAIDEAQLFLARHEETLYRFQRVSELIEGFESSFGLELLATVHWAMKHESITSSEEVTNYIYNWNERKQQFSPRQITLAMDILKKKQWV